MSRAARSPLVFAELAELRRRGVELPHVDAPTRAGLTDLQGYASRLVTLFRVGGGDRRRSRRGSTPAVRNPNP